MIQTSTLLFQPKCILLFGCSWDLIKPLKMLKEFDIYDGELYNNNKLKFYIEENLYNNLRIQ